MLGAGGRAAAECWKAGEACRGSWDMLDAGEDCRCRGVQAGQTQRETEPQRAESSRSQMANFGAFGEWCVLIGHTVDVQVVRTYVRSCNRFFTVSIFRLCIIRVPSTTTTTCHGHSSQFDIVASRFPLHTTRCEHVLRDLQRQTTSTYEYTKTQLYSHRHIAVKNV